MGSAGHGSEGADGGTTDQGRKAKPVKPAREKPRKDLENANVCMRMYPSEIKDYYEVLRKKLDGVKGATGVNVDKNANWVNLTYTAKDWEDAKQLETAADSVAVPARLISPATVEFGLTPVKNAKTDKKALEERLGETAVYDYDLGGSSLKIRTNLLSTNWGGLFADAADCGYELTFKSHVFHKLVVKKADSDEPAVFEEFTAKLYKNKGVLLVGQVPDQKGRFGIITTSEVPEKAMNDILKDLGYKAEKFQ